MIRLGGLTAFLVLVIVPANVSAARSQDIPGIEVCTAEKTMERRTSRRRATSIFSRGRSQNRRSKTGNGEMRRTGRSKA